MIRRILLMCVVMSVLFGIVWLIPQFRFKFINIFPGNPKLIFIQPPNGLNTEAKSKLKKLLSEINYLQPTYIPANFIKSYDEVSDNGIYTRYDALDTKLNYSGLNLSQLPVSNPRTKTFNEVIIDTKPIKSTDNRYLVKQLSINSYKAVYVETPPQLLDPYFDRGFAGSTEQELVKSNSEKSLYLFTPKSTILFTIGYANNITSFTAETELTKMAKSLDFGTIPNLLKLNFQDKAEISTALIQKTANTLVHAYGLYLTNKNEFPWQTSSECFKGNPPQEVRLDSSQNEDCLKLLDPYINRMVNTMGDNSFDKSVYPFLYITYGDGENFIQPKWINDTLEIYKSKLPKVCYKPSELSGTVKSYLNRKIPGYDNTYSSYGDGYPMYTKSGKVDEGCKIDPINKECYSCSDSALDRIYNLCQNCP